MSVAVQSACPFFFLLRVGRAHPSSSASRASVIPVAAWAAETARVHFADNVSLMRERLHTVAVIGQGLSHERFLAWEVACGRSPCTVGLDRTVARSVARLVDVDVADLTEDLAEVWWQALRHRAPATRATYLRSLRRYYVWRSARGGGEDPTRLLAAPRVPPGLPRPVPARDVMLALAMTDGDTRVQLALAAYAGLRVSEIAALRPQDVQEAPDGRPWLLVHGKGSRWRSVPLTPVLEQLLASYGWPSTNGPNLTVRLRLAMHRLGLPYSAHQLRHAFATEVLAASSNLVTVQRLLGHASVRTTQVYADVSSAQLHEAVAAAFDVDVRAAV